jgi:hypothetical protein
VGALVGKSPQMLKLICGGKVLQEGPTLQEQGVKVRCPIGCSDILNVRSFLHFLTVSGNLRPKYEILFFVTFSLCIADLVFYGRKTQKSPWGERIFVFFSKSVGVSIEIS